MSLRAKQRKTQRGSSPSRTGASEAVGIDEASPGISLGPLPQDLVTVILQRLPLPALVRLRLLSSAWNALLCSPTYLRLVCSGAQAPWLVTVRVAGPNSGTVRVAGPNSGILFLKELIAYIPALGSWFRLPISMNPHLVAATSPGLLQVPLHKFINYCPVPSSLAMASWGGLICAVITAPHPYPLVPKEPMILDMHYSYQMYEDDFRLLVFNCITGASKWLPCPPRPHRIRSPPPAFYPCGLGRPPSPPPCPALSTELHVTMLPDASAPGAYFVVLDHSKQLETQLCVLSNYSSKTGRWRNGHVHASGNPSLGSFDQIQNADLFVYHEYNESQHSMPHHAFLSAYALESDAWMFIHITPPVPLGYNHLTFKWQGRVFLAKSFYEFEHGLSHGLEILELSASSRSSSSASWKEVARTPQAFMHNYAYDNFQAFASKILHGGNVVWRTGLQNFDEKFGNAHAPVLVYDLAGGFWYELPPPCSNGASTAYGDGVFAFQPSLFATP